MEPTVDPVAEAAKLPLAERVAHKNWKVREAAYRELADKFNIAEEDAKIYSDFFASIGKIVRDANAPAQLVGFDAVSKYAETAPPQLVRRTAADVSKGIVEKGLAGRPVNKAKAVEAFLAYVGADAGDLAAEAMAATGFKHRTPKVVAASVDALTQAVDTYGTGAVPVKAITSKLPPLFEHSQEAVRNAAKTLIIELHRWVGDAVKAVLKGAKEVTVKELEAVFSQNAGKGKPQPKKLTRSMEQRVRERGGDGEVSDEDDGFGGGVQEEEELDLAEEISLIEKLSKVKIEIEEGVTKDWYTAIDSKKWSARKDALDTAVNIIGENRLIPGNHQDVFVRLRKILAKDSNVNVVASAAKLIRAMSNGLKKNFPGGAAKALTVDLFSRLKEKNRILVEAVSAALDALHSKKCIRVVDMLEEISVAAKHKVPKARCELLLWLGRSIRNDTPGADLKGPPLKCFGLLFLTATDDSAPEVRDAGLSGLASLQKVVGERNVAAFMEKLDKKRKEKVAAIVAELPQPKNIASTGAKSSKTAKPPPKKTGLSAKASSPGQKAGKRKSSSSPMKRPKPAKTGNRPLEDSDDEGEIKYKPEDALSEATERIEGFEKEQWSAKSFKARVAIVSLVNDYLREKESFNADDVSFALGLLSCEPGLGDSNFMSLKPKLELFGMVASKCAAPPPRKTLRPLLSNAVEKLGDIKSAKIVSEILVSYAEATSPRYFFEILAQAVLETNNGRAVSGMLKFAGAIVEDFGIPAVPIKPIAKVVTVMIGNAAPAARNAALALACKAASRFKGGDFRKLMEEHQATDEVQELFNTEIQKYGREPDPPTRRKKFGSQLDSTGPREYLRAVEEGETVVEPNGNAELGPEVETTADSPSQPPRAPISTKQPERVASKPKNVAAAKEVEPVEVLAKPTVRVSIAEHFAPGARIFVDLKNSNWKKRQEALASVDSIIANGNDFVKGDVGSEIVVALRARLSDSNRNLATAAYAVVCRLVSAMGSDGVMHLRILAPAVFGQGCVDIKKATREAAMKVVTAWYDLLGLSPLISHCPLPLGSPNSSFRKEFLDWLVPRLQGEVGSFDSAQEDLLCLVDPVLACLRDRTTEVRHLADQVLEQVIKSVGIATIDSKIISMTKSAKHQLEPVLEKYRGSTVSVSAEPPPARATNIPTPRSGRERPRSVAIPRTPLNRRGGTVADEDGTPAPAARRPRPASARMSPMVSSLAGFGGSGRSKLANNQVLIENDGREARARRFLNKRRLFMEELAQTDPTGEMSPMISEDMEDLTEDLQTCCSVALCTKLTAPPNRFRMHVEAIEMASAQMEYQPESVLFAADVLLRWCACRIEDSRTPPTVLIKLGSFVRSICEILMSSGATLGEYEACAVLPSVVEKCGSNRENIRLAMGATLQAISDVVDDETLLILLTSCLRYPVSPRAHEEVSSEICRLIEKRCASGAGIPPGVLPTIGRVAGGEDEGAGRAAALCLERAHEYFGDDLWNLVGELTDRQAARLDERLTGVGGMRHEFSPSPGGAMQAAPEPDESSGSADQYAATAAAGALPGDIRNEDFRLSVAPAPPSTVMNSINESLNAATPVKTRVEMGQAPVAETPALPSRSRRAVDSNHENEELVNDILLRLRSNDRDLQLSGLASLFDDLKGEGVLLKCERGIELLPQLVLCFTDTLRRLEGGSAMEDDPAVLKSFLKGVIRFAREPDLLRRLDQSAVEGLLGDALNAMIPQRVQGVDDWDQVRRGVNLMIVKVLESCDQNLLYTAMINLLIQNLKAIQGPDGGKVSSSIAKSSICIKSIAKVTKRGFKNCRINALLRDMHLFLMANPVRRDGTSSSEDQTFAMRLLKTVVNSLIDEMGSDIRLHLDLIPQPERSQLVHYVDMTLADLRRAKGEEGAGSPAEDRKQEAELSVAGCLSRIEAGGNSEIALQQLRSLLGWCPEVDLESQLQRFSAEVRSFVTEGLQKARGLDLNSDEPVITKQEAQATFLGLDDSGKGENVPPKEEERAVEKAIEAPMPAHADEPTSTSSSAAHSAGQVYLKRLQEIQLRYGLQTGTGGGDGTRRGKTEKENGAVEKTSAEETRGKASALRERMARIRELQSASKK